MNSSPPGSLAEDVVEAGHASARPPTELEVQEVVVELDIVLGVVLVLPVMVLGVHVASVGVVTVQAQQVVYSVHAVHGEAALRGILLTVVTIITITIRVVVTITTISSDVLHHADVPVSAAALVLALHPGEEGGQGEAAHQPGHGHKGEGEGGSLQLTAH